jgi:hypothetical protein
LVGRRISAYDLDGIRIPYVNETSGYQEYICTTNKTISLINPIPGRITSWSVTNPSLFATSGGATTSGTTPNAILRAANSTTAGSAVLTFKLLLSGCTEISISRNLWVGVPSPPSLTPSNYVQLNMGYAQDLYISTAPGSTNYANWTTSGPISAQYSNLSWNRFTPTNPGYAATYATSYNICGTSAPAVVNFYIPNNMKIYPNIASSADIVKIIDQL